MGIKKESTGAKELKDQLELVETIKKAEKVLKTSKEEKPVENFERKIGERFDYEGTTLEVIRTTLDSPCKECIFAKDKVNRVCQIKDSPILGSCNPLTRSDLYGVSFKQVVANSNAPKNLTKFPHYFAKVPNFTHLDIYMVSEMFQLNSYQHHIIKKAIATGKRGSKDQVKDLQEVIATAEAWIEVIKSEEV